MGTRLMGARLMDIRRTPRRTLLLSALLLWPAAAPAADFAAAFLENGLGARALGMGAAFTAVADDASAAYWNPAGVVWKKGSDAQASLQPLSQDRTQSALVVRVNPRGELAFALAWQHAGTGDLVARDAGGRPLDEKLGDSQNAYYVAIGRRLGPHIALGATLKRLNHAIDVPGLGTSSGSGTAVDLGGRLRLNQALTLGLTARNLGGQLKWSVRRSSGQNTETINDLAKTLTLGLAYRPTGRILVALDARHSNVSTHANVGFEWHVNPLLTVRGGLRRLPGDDRAVGFSSLGLTLRPMRNERLQFHYAYATEELEAGNRTVAGLSLVF